jgi:hypothetical protein
MNINDYRRKIEESVKKVQARQSRTPTRRRPQDPRRVISDKKVAVKTRVEALGRVTRAEGQDAVPGTALERLADTRESPAVRLAAIRLLQQKQFVSPVAAEWRPAFVEALRSALAEPRLRAAALEVLSLYKDRPTQERLIEGIRNPKRALVPVEEALRLLSTDVHADVVDVAKTLTNLRQARKNRAAFMQAVRILAADPGSVDTLEEVMAGDAYNVEARRLAATAISHLAPERVERAAQAETGAGARGARRPGKRGAAAKQAAKPRGALARHLDTLQRIRG